LTRAVDCFSNWHSCAHSWCFCRVSSSNGWRWSVWGQNWTFRCKPDTMRGRVQSSRSARSLTPSASALYLTRPRLIRLAVMSFLWLAVLAKGNSTNPRLEKMGLDSPNYEVKTIAPCRLDLEDDQTTGKSQDLPRSRTVQVSARLPSL